MTKNEAIKNAIDALSTEAISSSQDERVEQALVELGKGEISAQTIAFMDESIESWWGVFGAGLGGEESIGEILIKQLEEARDNLKEFI